MRNSPLKAYAANSQGLSPTALKAKRVRDKEAAMTPLRKQRKAGNQKEGQRSNSDIHHKPDGTTVRISTKNNRNVWKHGERT